MQSHKGLHQYSTAALGTFTGYMPGSLFAELVFSLTLYVLTVMSHKVNSFETNRFKISMSKFQRIGFLKYSIQFFFYNQDVPYSPHFIFKDTPIR